jgi:thymidylate kinase
MLISFTGSQSSGKTTLLNALRKHLYEDGDLPDWTVIDEVTRKIARQGMPINNEAPDYNQTQLMIINDHLANINNYIKEGKTKTALDRCLLDGLVYTEYFYRNKKVSKHVRDYAQRAFETSFKNYDHVFYIEPVDTSLVDDGVRSTDSKFRADIVIIFEEVIKYYSDKSGRNIVIRLSGTVQKRLETLLSVIYNTNYGIKY